MPSVLKRIETYNAGRDAVLLERKLSAMEANPFVFFRGTCHIFWQDWKGGNLNKSPAVWSCGDLHIENFGSFKGDNRLVYFDMNDFDEALLAPAAIEVTRLVTSLFVGAAAMNVNEHEASALAGVLVGSYAETLAQGQARSVESATARGLIRDFLDATIQRSRKKFLDKRSESRKSKRKFIIDDVKYRKLDSAKSDALKALMEELAKTEGDFFKYHDAAQRVAGTGSLGLERYAIIVEGRGFPYGNFILDLKEAKDAAGAAYTRVRQPKWSNAAERVVEVQKRMQCTPPAFLKSVPFQGKSFVLKELQPSQDKMDLTAWDGRLRRLEKVIAMMGRIVAWNQLRSGGRQGSAIADELIDYARNGETWGKAVLEYARSYAERVRKDHAAFVSERAQSRGPGR